MTKKEKIARIKKDWKLGKIGKIGDGMYRPSAEYFVLGITARLLDKVLSRKSISTAARGRR